MVAMIVAALAYSIGGRPPRDGRARRSARAVEAEAPAAALAAPELQFDNKVLRRLVLDGEVGGAPRQVRGSHFVRVAPTPLVEPRLAATSAEALELLDIELETEGGGASAQEAALAQYFAGNAILLGAEPAAHCYCGHQFGTFAGQLGDGAAMYLGEVVNRRGERWELQLKGAGLTPFSRSADGRKVLRSSLREFLCSEAMHHLGVPTTRAAALVVSDSRVRRDVLYDGHPRDERCAVVARVARSFLRFGSFEVAAWQAVGFVHGVLNTDNMAVTGDTIDYGPFGFLDAYDPDGDPNTSDAAGRYSYANQPRACRFNLEKLAEALAPLLDEGAAERELAAFWPTYEAERTARFRRKLGLLLLDEGDADEALLDALLALMHRTCADFTNVFRALARIELPASEEDCAAAPQVFDPALEYVLANCLSYDMALKRSRPTFHPRALARLQEIAATSPEQLASFGIDESVVAREVGRAQTHSRLSETSPRSKRLADAAAWTEWLVSYRRRLLRERGAAAEPAAHARRRVGVMNAENPRFVLRNHLAANAITKAERGDFSEVGRLLGVLRRPYDDHGYLVAEQLGGPPPDWAHDLVLT